MASVYSRATVAEHLALARMLEEDGFSQRQQVACMDIPRSTLRDWQQRQAQIDVDPAWVSFFTSPAGEAFLQRMMVALHVLLELVGGGGIRLVSRFLELTLLDRFVAPSYGAQHGMAMNVEEAVVAFGQEEGHRLGASMPARQIATCEDETFHPEPCLVAIEPVSNFIVLEQYACDSTAATWTQALRAALGDWPVVIVQVTADEGRALSHHIKEELGVHHTSDLFHIQQDGVQATSAGLARRTRQAEKTLTQVQEQVAAVEAHQATYEQGPRPAGRPPDFARRLQVAQTAVTQAQQTLDTAQHQQEQAQKARQGINQAYHPYDLNTGTPRSPETVEADLKRHMDTLDTLVQQADLSDRCRQKVKKLRGHLTNMVATITFFFMMIQLKIEALDLAPEVETAVYRDLIPACYLAEVAGKAPTAEQRHRLHHQAQQLAASWQARAGPISALTQEERTLIEAVAQECAQVFQRSSACVEGRNGQLAWHHHHLHQIRPRKLHALTVVHNYFTRRADGTTAAQRFFGAPPRDLFEWVLERVPLPGWPAQKRPTPHVTGSLTRN